jgi:hypothetical protein
VEEKQNRDRRGEPGKEIKRGPAAPELYDLKRLLLLTGMFDRKLPADKERAP